MTRSPEFALPIGSTFEGRYEILDELGTGSFGRVYKARQLSTSQFVAIKVLRFPESEGAGSVDAQVRRFEREMRLCAELSHPNIVRLVDSGESENGALHAVFEYVPGLTLAEVLAEEGALEMRETLHLMTQVLDALACAHRAGIVHRDLKPSNVMVSQTGVRRNAQVLDFGLGGFLDERRSRESRVVTQTGEFMGTPLYAAPEQLWGKSASARSDLYSWGLILLECLLGKHALEGNAEAGVLRVVGGGEKVPIPEWLQGQRLGRLLETVTAPEVEKRDVTVDGLLRAMQRVEWSEQRVSPEREPEPLAAGVRRQVTVVSCRILLLTSDPDALDLEEQNTLLRGQLDACADTAMRRGGELVSRLGNRVLLCFGLQQTGEDDARRAAAASLEIVEEIGHRGRTLHEERSVGLEVRIGLHTGLAVTREGVGVSGRGAMDVVGATPETAADLDGLAGPGEVLMSEEARRLVEPDFETEPTGEQRLGGLSRAVPVFRLRRRGRGVRTPAGEPPFVARAGELQQLVDAWRRAQAGMPGCVLVKGDAGMGKSRLVRELRRQAAGGSWLACRCLPETRDTPLRPLVDLLATSEETIETLLTRHRLEPAENVPLFRTLLSLPADERYPPLQVSRERQSDLTLGAILHLLTNMAEKQPVALIVEDLQWADPTTLELLGRLVQEVKATQLLGTESGPRLLAVFTARSEFEPSWSPLITADLPRLSGSQVRKMIDGILETKGTLPGRLLDQVVSRADGVPLFVEEVTRALVEGGALSELGSEAQEASRPFEIPSSLRGLLTARLDALSPDASETARLAAALGREFEYDLLEAASPKDGAVLRQDLAELTDVGIVLPRRGSRGKRYVFKHVLLRDVAYDFMLRSERRRCHARIARVLQERFPEVEALQPEVLAYQFEGAGEFDAAADLRKRAGDRATARGAYLEGIRHFERGLALLEGQEPSRDRIQRELGLTESLGTALFSTRGYGAPEVDETFSRARQLCDALGGDIPFRVLWGLWAVQIVRGDKQETAAILEHLRRRSETRRDPVSLLSAHAAAGYRAYYQGDFSEAFAESIQALAWYPSPEFQAFVHDYGYDIGMYAFATVMVSLSSLGYAEQALEVGRKMLSIADEAGNPYSLAIARGQLMNLLREVGDLESSLEMAEQQIAEVTEQRIHYWLGMARCARGWVWARRGDLEQGIAEIRQGLEFCRGIGVRTVLPYLLGGLAEAQLWAGNAEAGIAAVDEGLGLCTTLLDRFNEGELVRLKGELLRLRGDDAESEAHFRRALELARRCKGKAYELRAATSLARLLDDRGDRQQAKELLGGVYDWFSEGADASTLRTAREILEALA
jgi:TOMM system kinase/cyclase fusion protein